MTTTPKDLNPDLPVGTRVKDQWGNVGTVKRIGFQRAVQGFGIVTPCDVDLDDGRKVSTVTWRLTALEVQA